MVVFDLSLMFSIPGPIILPLALLVGILAGLLNGGLIVLLRLQPFIATLATLAAYRGLVYAISGRQLVPGLSTTPIRDPWIIGIESYYDVGGWLGLTQFIGMPWIPMSFFIMLGLLGCFIVLLHFTRFGRDLYAVGGNAEAARLAGIKTGRIILVAYALSGLCAALAALILVARFTTSTEALGNGMELTAIAAAVIGGVSLAGGVGSVFGPVIGAFLLGAVLLGLTQMGISQFVQQILTGVILLAAVGYDRVMVLRARQKAIANIAEAT